MAATVPGSSVSAARIDPVQQRHPLEKDDLELNVVAKAWLATLAEADRPKELARRFPRIVNRIAGLWKIPLQMDRYFDDLLTDNRGNRQGFPLAVLSELSGLKDLYNTKVYPTRKSVWDA